MKQLGCLIGGVLAATMSWMHWHSIFLALIHFMLGWLYVLYAVLRYGVPQW